MATEILFIIGIFIFSIVLVVSYFKTRHTERMALINSGRTARVFDEKKDDSNNTLKIGLFLLSIGLGLMVGIIVDTIFDTTPAASFVSILVMGGSSLIIYHFYKENKEKANSNNTDDLV